MASTREIHFKDGFNHGLESAAKFFENLRDCDRLPTLDEVIVYIRSLKAEPEHSPGCDEGKRFPNCPACQKIWEGAPVVAPTGEET